MIEILMPDEYPERRNLLDQEQRAKLPPLYSTEEKHLDAQAMVKFFAPDSDWTWYAAEFDGDDLLYGLVVGNEIRLDYFSLYELETAKGVLGIPVERDIGYEPKSLQELIELHKHQRIEKTGGQNELLEKIKSFAGKLSEWDKRIVEVIGIGSANNKILQPSDLVELVCIFDPEPRDDGQGFFSIVNLMTRDEFEGVSELLDIPNSIDLGFMLKGKYHLPKGKIIEKPENQITIWRQLNERDFDK